MKNLILGVIVLSLLAGLFFAFSGSSGNGGDDGASSGSGKWEDGRGNNMMRVSDDGNNTTSSSDDSRLRSGMMGRGSDDGDNESGDDSRLRMMISSRLRELMQSRGKSMDDFKRFASQNNLTIGEATRLLINESRLECSKESTMMERIKCRLKLPEKEQKEGLYYMPEECRNMTGDNRSMCMVKYNQVQPCRFEKGDDNRFSCVRERLGMNKSAKELVEDCKEMVRGNLTNSTNSSNSTRGIGKCVSSVRSKVEDMAKFRLYNLEEKAERLGKLGVNETLVANFIAKMETLKAKFNAAEGVDEKKAVLEEAKLAWETFFADAKAQLKANRPARNATNSTGDD